jgi:signal transduction histidine kinase/ActR/RegA family two-component response regulator
MSRLGRFFGRLTGWLPLGGAAGYAVAVAAVGLAVLPKVFVEPLGRQSPFLLLGSAVMLAAWVGDLGPGVAATLLAAVAAVSLFSVPVPAALAFLLEGAVITGLFAWAHHAVRRAERQHRASQALAEVGRLLTGSLDPAVVAGRVVESVCRLTNAMTAVLYRVDAPAGALVSLAAAGVASEARRPGVAIPLGAGIVGLAVRERRAAATTDLFADPRISLAADVRARAEAAGFRAACAVPLVVNDQVVGVLGIGDRAGRRFGREDVGLLRAFADQASLALENARRFEGEQRGREVAERDRVRSRLVAEASEAVARSLDDEAALGELARLVVPALADWCFVDLLDEQGERRRLAVTHADPAKAGLARALREHGAPDPAPVLASGYPRLDVEPAGPGPVWSESSGSRLVREAGLASIMTVPLRVRGRTLGALTFATAESGRRYGPDDLAVAEELARRAGLAVETARLYREAQAANRLKDEFLAIVSHELRTPLNAIMGWASLLRTGRLDPVRSAQALDTIERNVRTQAQIVADLLDVSRIITGKLALDVQLVDLVPVVEAALDVLRPAAAGKQIALDARLEPVGPVSGDPQRLQQVVWNLLSNSVKFTPPGGRVEVVLARVGQAARIHVRDTGQGIPADFLPHVFDRFRQADASTTRRHGGLGLGLAIVRHLVELHGGHVEAASDGPDRGATFTVTLPLRPLQMPLQLPRADADPELDAAELAVLRGLHVLVVDDEPDTREVAAAVLERCGCRVSLADGAAPALALFDRDRPDVLLVDLAMPGEDGYSLLRRVRGRPPGEGGQVPAAALTAHASTEDRARALAAGFQMHLAKPVTAGTLAWATARLARTRRVA